MAVNALLVLLREKFNPAFIAEKKIKRLARMGDVYPEEIKQWIGELLHHDVKRRNKALMKDIRHFETLTADIYLRNQEKKKEAEYASNNVMKERNRTAVSPKASPKRETAFMIKTRYGVGQTKKNISLEKTV